MAKCLACLFSCPDHNSAFIARRPQLSASKMVVLNRSQNALLRSLLRSAAGPSTSSAPRVTPRAAARLPQFQAGQHCRRTLVTSTLLRKDAQTAQPQAGGLESQGQQPAIDTPPETTHRREDIDVRLNLMLFRWDRFLSFCETLTFGFVSPSYRCDSIAFNARDPSCSNIEADAGFLRTHLWTHVHRSHAACSMVARDRVGSTCNQAVWPSGLRSLFYRATLRFYPLRRDESLSGCNKRYRPPI